MVSPDYEDATYYVIVRKKKLKGQKGAKIHGVGTVGVMGDSATIMITQRFRGRSILLAMLLFYVVIRIITESLITQGTGPSIVPGWLLIAIFLYYILYYILYYFLTTEKHVFMVALDETNVLFDPGLKAVFFRIDNGKWIATKCKAQPNKFFLDIKNRMCRNCKGADGTDVICRAHYARPGSQ